MKHTVIVESSDGTQSGFMLEYCEWLGWDAPAPQEIYIPLHEVDGKFIGEIDLPDDRDWRFKCTIATNVKVAIALDPPRPIAWPYKAKWPVVKEGPAGGSNALVIYFTTKVQP
ncbi:MAG: hypothetical protein ACAH11_00215 [Sphingomonas sp.]